MVTIFYFYLFLNILLFCSNIILWEASRAISFNLVSLVCKIMRPFGRIITFEEKGFSVYIVLQERNAYILRVGKKTSTIYVI